MSVMKLKLSPMDRTTELRKLPPATVIKLGQILDPGNSWKTLMSIIPVNPDDINSPPKYSVEHIKLIESVGEKYGRSHTEILLDEWGTSGKMRPNLEILLQILIKAEMYRAVDYVAVDLLKESPPERPAAGPAALVDLTLPVKVEANEVEVPHVPFLALNIVTEGFDDTPFLKIEDPDGSIHYSGHKLGSGAFGSVYYGRMNNGTQVAVKKLSTDTVNLTTQFTNEIKTLSEYKHENLVPLLAYSCNTNNYCLVYEFMSNGSLMDKLKVSKNCNDTNEILNGDASAMITFTSKPLSWIRRLQIAIDTCSGIDFLHNSKPTPLIHRDVKTANILLDGKLVAKLGDFGLVKVKPNVSESKMITSTVFGTSAYMAPEAFRGDVSVKMDVFSLGVVLLELLTGLPPYDENREGCDLVTYIEEMVEDSIDFLLDGTAGNWDIGLAQQIFILSQNCLEEKKKRPLISAVLERLKALQENISEA